MIRFVLWALVLLCLSMPESRADGLTYNGHIDGPATTLKLNGDQVRKLNKGADKITLTLQQLQTFKMIPGYQKVKELWVYPRNAQTCTCELHNVALRVKPDSIEVADLFFATENDNWNDHIYWSKRSLEQEAAQKAEMALPIVTPEARLNALGRKEHSSKEKAITYFLKALKINPNHKWSRRNLSMIYYYLGSNALYNKNYLKARHNLELAMKYADPDDSLFNIHLGRELGVARLHTPTIK